MASFRRALPSLARCERPRKAFSRFFRDQPGRLAQGPEEKCVLTGRLAGLRAVVICLPFQIDAPRWGGVARGVSEGKRARCQESYESGGCADGWLRRADARWRRAWLTGLV